MTSTPSGRAPLRPGSRLGHYEIVGLLGAGGMGEVYRARDPRLGRDVAIKVIAFDVGADPDRLRRFEQEARTVAAINHPNILSVHDVGSEAGSPYLVLELLEGESLGQQMRRERLPVRKALEIAVQIARGLAAAHQRGVVHRDVKPDNVFVTKDGGAKLLDFGLAKLMLGEAMGPATEYSTISGGTHPGMLLGTPGYMSPEQIRGQASDARSDIFSFGVVLYELLTAQRPFRKDTPAETLAAILNEDPPFLTSHDATLPAALDRIVRRCLEKMPEERFHSAHDLALALEAVAGGSNVTGPVSSPPNLARSSTSRVVLVALGALALGAAGWALRGLVRRGDPWIGQPVTRFTLPLPAGTLLANSYPSVSISRDGMLLALVAQREGVRSLYVRGLDELAWKQLPGTVGALGPFFSPNREWLAYFTPGNLLRVSLAGGMPQVVCPVAGMLGYDKPNGDWGEDGRIVFSYFPMTEPWSVPAAGGTPQRVTRLGPAPPRSVWYRKPQILSGGRGLLFGTWTPGRARVEILPPEPGERRILADSATDGSLTRTGHLIYGWDNQLLAVPFDSQKLSVSGVPVPVVEGVRSFGGPPIATDYSLSENGTLVYASAPKTLRRLVWADRAGRISPLPLPPRNYRFPALSPNGDHVAVTISDGKASDIWIGDLRRGNLSRLTRDGDAAIFSLWSPNGKDVVFSSARQGSYNVFRKSVGATGEAERLTNSPNPQRATGFSADGRLLLFHDVDPTTLPDLWVLPLGERRPVLLVRTSATERSGTFSPDGRWLAFDSDESGRYEVYVQAYPGPGEKRQISTGGGGNPMWNPNGREIFYTNEDQLLGAAFLARGSLEIGTPRLLFQAPMIPGEGPGRREYDVTADGEHFLFVEEPTPPELHVVVNWFEELKRRVPVGSQRQQ